MTRAEKETAPACEAGLQKKQGLPPALILGSGITALGAIRNLARYGIRTIAAGPALEAYVRRSRWCHPLPDRANAAWTAAALEGCLGRSPLKAAVLIPCADDWQLAAASLPPGLISRFPTSGPSLEVVRTMIDKERLAEALREQDVPHPRTVALRAPQDLDRIDEETIRGAFLKPRDSQRFSRRFGIKAVRCRDRADARGHLERLSNEGSGFVLQEYVPGPPTAHCFIDGFIDRAHRVCGRLARRRLRMHPPEFGNSSLMESVSLDEAAEPAAALDRFLAALGYRGTFSAEFKRDERDGVWKLLEINCRQWWYVGFAASCGVNVTRMAYLDALDLPVEPVDRYRVGVRCVHPYYDALACARLLRERRSSFWGCARPWIGAAQPVFCWDDPMPAAAHLVMIVGRSVGRRLGLWKGTGAVRPS